MRLNPTPWGVSWEGRRVEEGRGPYETQGSGSVVSKEPSDLDPVNLSVWSTESLLHRSPSFTLFFYTSGNHSGSLKVRVRHSPVDLWTRDAVESFYLLRFCVFTDQVPQPVPIEKLYSKYYPHSVLPPSKSGPSEGPSPF